MLHVVLYEPEIPPNTGNIIRLCANTGFHLHLVEPLGFEMNDKRLRRAGLDYGEWQDVSVYRGWQHYLDVAQPQRVYALSTKGCKLYSAVQFQPGDTLVFGPETRGLPQGLLEDLGKEAVLRLPMQSHSRSLNLSNTAAIVVYEAWRQLDFAGGA